MARFQSALSRVAALVVFALPFASLQAQADSASGRTRSGGAYDAAQSVTMTGVTIIRVDTVRTGGGASLSAVIAAGSDSVTALLAPAEFMSAKLLTLAAGDVIDITGGKVTMGGKPGLIATEIKKGAATVTLRDKATGAPAWRDGMQRPE
jgi:hypothetical protein